MNSAIKDRWALGIVLVVSLAAVLPFLVGSVTDFEETHSTAVPMTLAFRALADGASPFWTPLLGLGLPQPFRISYLLHPLGPVFAASAIAGVNVLTAVHLIVGAAATYYLAIYLGLTRLAAIVCVVSIVFSTTIVQSIYTDDWFTHVVTWSALPLAALLLLRLLDSTDRRSAALFALALGLVVGFQFATGIITRAMSQLLILAPLALARPRALVQKLGWLAGAGAIAVIAGAANWLVLLEEYLYTVDASARASHPNFALFDHLWGAFVQPFAEIAGVAHPPGAAAWRVIGFGPVLAILAAIQLFRRPASVNLRAIHIGLAASIVYMVLPPIASYNIFKATWTFRDGVNLYGILLGGFLLSSLRPRAAYALGAVQCVLVVVAAWPLLKASTTRAIWPDIATRASAHDLAAGSDVVRALQSRAAAGHMRLLPTPSIRQQGYFPRDGIVINSLAYFGVPIVEAFARGVATNSLHPDAGLLEGVIRPHPTMLFDPNFLNVLAITHVLGRPGDKHGAGLVLDEELTSRGGQTIHLWRNPNAWPPAVFLDEDARNVRLPRRAGCGHERYLCADFAPVLRYRVDGPPIDIVQRHGRITLQLAPADTARTVMISIWYRPGWHASRPGISIFPVFEQLTGVRIPAGVGDVTLDFLPPVRLWTHVAGGATFLVGSIALVLLAVGRRRGRR